MALPLPSRVVATYFTLWGGGARITSVPLDYNMIYLFHAVPAGGGAFSFGYGNSVNAAEIDQCQARGQRVVLTVGGANAGFNFSSRAQSDAFIASFKRMYDQLGGVDGCDFNNFEAHVGSSPTEMVYIAQQLKALYGSDFSITAPPAPGAGWAPMDRTLTAAMAKAGVMDFAGPQFYDSPDLTQLGTITSLIDEWVVNMGDASKVVIGLTSNYGAGPTLATSQEAWKRCVAKHPKLRGVFAWSAQDDAAGSWNFGKVMGPLVKAGGTTPAPAPVPAPSPTPTPSPVPAPAPSTGAVKWTAGVRYSLNTIVQYPANGKYYQVYQVDATGTSNGTDPVISTWYWKQVAAPAPAPAPTPVPAPAPTPVPAPAPTAPFSVGDKVKIPAASGSGTITAISGNTATVKLDTTVTLDFSLLTKA